MMTKKTRNAKTTFHIEPAVLKEFQSCVSALDLRRDKYLNRVLPIAVRWLRRANRNSPTAEKLHRSMRDLRAHSLQKIAVSINVETLRHLNAVCAEKRIPRDVFFQSLLETLTRPAANGNGPAPLPSALTLIQDPWSQWVGAKDETPFDDVIWPEFDQDDLQDAMQEVRKRKENVRRAKA